jgi:hypothetical protein
MRVMRETGVWKMEDISLQGRKEGGKAGRQEAAAEAAG